MHNSTQELIDTFLDKKSDLPKIIVIYGPTACWKTALSIEVAKYIQSEIISTDSRQIYRYMDIGTGKITESEKDWVPHHMIDIIEPDKICSVVDFVRWAIPHIERIICDKKIPILCGWTGLYIDGILYEMAYPETPPDWDYRDNLEEIRQKEWNQKLWDMLYAVDPDYANELEVWNYRYIMRGLEVMEKTGKSKWDSKWKKTPRFDPLFITPYNDNNREKLYSTINSRVEEMFNNWLIYEINYIIEKYGAKCPGLTTIWYREIVDAVEWTITLNEAKSLVQQRSRNYAKRQITWNKRYEYNS